MKQHELDELLTAAFDGGAGGDGKDAGELRMLKSDLIRLRTELPECQISTERMRDAILNAGIKPKRNYWNWLAPVGAVTACLAFVMIFRSGSESVRGAENLAVPVIQSPVNEVVKADGEPTTVAKSTSGTEPQEDAHLAAPTVRREVRPAKRDTIRRVKKPVPAKIEPAATEAMTLAKHETASVSGGAAAETVVATAMGPWDVADAPGLIVIDTQEDADTGANRASEVATPNNVVISG